jgi:hypothetical protein
VEGLRYPSGMCIDWLLFVDQQLRSETFGIW